MSKASPAYMEGHYFSLPNEIFSLGLSADAIAIYAYLLRIEDRKKYICWAKYATIGAAVGIKSPKTVANALSELEKAGLIYREPTSMKKDGKYVNGVQLFTIRPFREAAQHHQWKQIDQIVAVAEAQAAEARVEKYNERHPDTPLAVQFTDHAS